MKKCTEKKHKKICWSCIERDIMYVLEDCQDASTLSNAPTDVLDVAAMHRAVKMIENDRLNAIEKGMPVKGKLNQIGLNFIISRYLDEVTKPPVAHLYGFPLFIDETIPNDEIHVVDVRGHKTIIKLSENGK